MVGRQPIEVPYFCDDGGEEKARSKNSNETDLKYDALLPPLWTSVGWGGGGCIWRHTSGHHVVSLERQILRPHGTNGCHGRVANAKFFFLLAPGSFPPLGDIADGEGGGVACAPCQALLVAHDAFTALFVVCLERRTQVQGPEDFAGYVLVVMDANKNRQTPP